MGISCLLSEALQRKDQDIINATILIRNVKDELALLEEQRWAGVLADNICFCEQHHLPFPVMAELRAPVLPRLRGRPPLAHGRTNEEYYMDAVFLPVVRQLREE